MLTLVPTVRLPWVICLYSTQPRGKWELSNGKGVYIPVLLFLFSFLASYGVLWFTYTQWVHL